MAPQNEVLLGPDLNESRNPFDKKEYRHILLPNGLRALLVSDTVAMAQTKDSNSDRGDSNIQPNDTDVEDDLAESDEEDSREDQEDDSMDDENDEEGGGIRSAAASMIVGVGSMYDPPEVQGLSHFLEHLLFMGSRKYPTENAYDKFISKHGGSDNAYTESEHTVYYFDIPQEHLEGALDIFAQFFIDPLMLESSVERELKSIESEFQLVKNSDGCRLQQLMCHTCGHRLGDHPMPQFSWGNMKSLKEIPEATKVDPLKKLREFYEKHYYASNMRLVVIGAFSLDSLQDYVVKSFSNVPHKGAGFSFDTHYEPGIKDVGMPFAGVSLQKVYYVVPVRDRHAINITWQVPPQMKFWKSKPCDYLAHLIGHEAEGSLLASLKSRSWATACCAGVGSEGYENASSHALFILSITLSEEGVIHWQNIVEEVYRYVGMLRYHCEKGLPPWIFEELKTMQEMSYRYEDEPSPEDFVESMAEMMAPAFDLPADRLLDAIPLLYEFNQDAVSDLLVNYFTPANARIDLTSSKFGRSADFEGACNMSTKVEVVDAPLSESLFDPKGATPLEEPLFGTPYWCQTIPSETLDKWTAISKAQLPSPESKLSLPKRNEFVPTKFELKLLPKEEYNDPVSPEDLDEAKKDSEESEADESTGFPSIPARLNPSQLPSLLCNTNVLKLWHLQDRLFKRPTAELRMLIYCADAGKSPLHAACSDLLVRLISESLNEVVYMASMCELSTSLASNDSGFSIRVHGFDDKLMTLFAIVLEMLLSFREEDNTVLPRGIQKERFDLCLESNLRRYSNAGMKASTLASDIRIKCLRPSLWSANEKAKEISTLDVPTFLKTVSETLGNIAFECLYHGNVDVSDAKHAQSEILRVLESSGGAVGLARTEYPDNLVTKVPNSPDITLRCAAKDPNEPNQAVEVYFQVGEDNTFDRVMVDFLMEMMYEPMFDQIRTTDQFGYSVSCDSRWTDGIIGIQIRVVSASKSAEEVEARIEKFLVDFRPTLSSMSREDYLEHMNGLAKRKLEAFNSLSEQTAHFWSEIRDGRYKFQVELDEVLVLRGISQRQLLEAYDKWLYPEGSATRRRFSVTVVSVDSLISEVPDLTQESCSDFNDSRVKAFQELCKHQTFGQIY